MCRSSAHIDAPCRRPPVLGQAQKTLLDDAKREVLRVGLDIARDEVRKERSKEVKHDTAVRLAAVLHDAGREGVEAEWEKSDAFHERWRLKVGAFCSDRRSRRHQRGGWARAAVLGEQFQGQGGGGCDADASAVGSCFVPFCV